MSLLDQSNASVVAVVQIAEAQADNAKMMTGLSVKNVSTMA
jgi:hypothetical protein